MKDLEDFFIPQLYSFRLDYQGDYSNPKDRRLDHMVNNSRYRAKQRGLEFSFTPDDLCPLPTKCPLLGAPIDYEKEGKGPNPNSPTIDRIDNSKGYISGNVWVISHRANCIKNDAAVGEILMVAMNLRKKIKELKDRESERIKQEADTRREKRRERKSNGWST